MGSSRASNVYIIDTAAALFVDEWILRPSCIQRTWTCLLQLGMPLLEISVGTASNTLAKFVAEHPHTDTKNPA